MSLRIDSSLLLNIELPFASFVQPRSHEYLASFDVPPPSTVRGMLLSLIGEEDSSTSADARVIIGVKEKPLKATTLRTCKRFKIKDINDPRNSRPDYQEVLCGLNLYVLIPQESNNEELLSRVKIALLSPHKINRYGGLSLGESRDLINSIKIISKESLRRCLWLIPDKRGDISLPIKNSYGESGFYAVDEWGRFSISAESPEELELCH